MNFFVMIREISANRLRLSLILCFVCVGKQCSGEVTEASVTDPQTIGTTGLEDIFSENVQHSQAQDNDVYYLNWIFDDGNNNGIDSTIDIHVNNRGSFNFFRHLKNMKTMRLKIGKLDKCSIYNVTLQAYNEFHDTEKYHRVFETSHNKIENIMENITSTSTSISWNNSCLNSQISIHKRSGVEVYEFTNYTNHIDFDHALYCISYSITALSANGTKIGHEINGATVPGPVTELTIEPSETSLHVTWMPPEDTSCVVGYTIYVNDIVMDTENTFIHELNSCSMFKIGVSSRSEDSHSAYEVMIATTSFPLEFNPIQNLKLVEEDVNIVCRWSALYQQKNCIQHYTVQINDGDKLQVFEEEHVLKNVVACQTYTVSIQAVNIDEDSESTKVEAIIIASAKAHSAPKMPSQIPGEDNIEFHVVTDLPAINACRLKNVRISCDALPEDNEDLEWVVKQRIETFPISTEETEFTLKLEKLSGITNYTCYGGSTTEPNLESTDSDGVKVTTTLPGLPAPVLKIEEITSTTFKVEWEKQEMARSYLIRIIPSGSVHYIPDGCDVKLDEINEPTEELTFLAKNLLPSYNYRVIVKSMTLWGESEPAEMDTITKTDGSESVREFIQSIEITENSIEIYDVSSELTWLYPCNTNGDITKFKIAIIATDLETETVENDTIEIDKIDGADYKYSLKLKPYCNYVVSINAIGELHEGNIADVIFQSTDGYPAAPETKVEAISHSNILLEWKKPNPANGEITSYQVDIKDLGPEFPVPNDCDVNISPPLQETLPSTSVDFSYTKALGNHKYEIKLMAITIGLGKPTTDTAVSLNSEPEPVRNFVKTLTSSQSTDKYDYILTLHFNQPCNLAGNFIEYKIKICGQRQGTEFEDHYEEYSISKVTAEDDTKTNLKAAYDYKITGTVVTDFGVSEEVTIAFKSDSGVPGVSPQKNITTPDSDSSITFTRSSFTDEHGDLLYFAILLSANYNFESDYGYWVVWPEVGSYTKTPAVIEPYQITNSHWAPPTENEEISFKVGSDQCEDLALYCNGPLREDTTYTVTVRGFTQQGYRDIRMQFNTPSLVPIISVGVILGITLGILFTGLIFLGSYLVYRRRLFGMKGKPALDTLNGHVGGGILGSAGGATGPFDGLGLGGACTVLAAGGGNQEDDDDDSGAEDFARLQRMSEKNRGSTTVAESDENRRRNRYVNILPYDSTRVVLYDGCESDYINATFIKGFSNQIEYIAAQGPLEGTAEDFWKMIAQEKVTTIIMLTQLREQNREKCFQYFPFINQTIRFNDLNVYGSEENVCKTYVRRKIILNIGTDQFNIQHYQYTDWPDFNVPEGTENIIKFVKKIRKLQAQIGGEILVHCSAGVGRTGTLISIDILLQKIDADEKWNIYQTVLDLRMQRINMVQNEKQYSYIGTCIEDYIKCKRRKSVYHIEMDEPIYENVKSVNY